MRRFFSALGILFFRRSFASALTAFLRSYKIEENTISDCVQDKPQVHIEAPGRKEGDQRSMIGTQTVVIQQGECRSDEIETQKIAQRRRKTILLV